MVFTLGLSYMALLLSNIAKLSSSMFFKLLQLSEELHYAREEARVAREKLNSPESVRMHP